MRLMLRRALVAAGVVLLTALQPAAASHRHRSDVPPGEEPARERIPRRPRTPGAGEAVTSEPRPSGEVGRGVRERTPEPPARRRASRVSLARSQVVSEGPEGGPRMIALTLDDGFNADPRILDLVESWEIRGTAFLVGAVVEDNPWLVRRLVRAGWEVCSHTYSHRILTGLSESSIEREIVRGAEAIDEAARGLRTTKCGYFRPPAGAVNGKVVAAARRLGYTVVNWNASISDSTSRSTPTALQVDIALRTIRPGSILLGHFGGAHSYFVLREVLQTIFERGYRVSTVTDLLRGRDVAAPGDEAGAATIDLPAAEPFAQPHAGWQQAAERVHPGGWAGVGFTALGGVLVSASSAFSRRRRWAAPNQGVAPDPEPVLSVV